MLCVQCMSVTCIVLSQAAKEYRIHAVANTNTHKLNAISTSSSSCDAHTRTHEILDERTFTVSLGMDRHNI